jgi:kumamolisin
MHHKWAQSFWQSWGIVRANPTIEVETEDPVTRYIEAQIDTTWAGAIAPGADLQIYCGADARNTAMVFTFNQAITRAQADGVSILTDSFAHREDSEPALVRQQYDDSALIAAALGLTVVAASGDSARPDTPSSSPWVTAVGGTRLTLDANGDVSSEIAWDKSGSGETLSFAQPPWQAAVAGDLSSARVVVDVSAAASTGSPYWVYYNNSWSLYGGTSFAAPVWAGVLAVINQARAANGLSPVGFLNPTLYSTPTVQSTFNDVSIGATDLFAAGPGWDVVSGWGTPDAAALASAIPSW